MSGSMRTPTWASVVILCCIGAVTLNLFHNNDNYFEFAFHQRVKLSLRVRGSADLKPPPGDLSREHVDETFVEASQASTEQTSSTNNVDTTVDDGDVDRRLPEHNVTGSGAMSDSVPTRKHPSTQQIAHNDKVSDVDEFQRLKQQILQLRTPQHVDITDGEQRTPDHRQGLPNFTLVTSAYGKYPTKYPVANALKRCYARRHHYEHVFDTSEPTNITRDRFRHKITIFQKILPTTKFAVFLDADLVIYNMHAKLEQFVDDAHDVFFMDGFELSSCVWIVRNSEWGRRFVDHVLASFTINGDDQGGITNLLVTMIMREQQGLDVLPADLAPSMPCGLQGELGLDEHLDRANKCFIEIFNKSLTNKLHTSASHQLGYRSIGRVKLLSAFDPHQRLMAYCCHSNAPVENKWLGLKGKVKYTTAIEAVQHGQSDTVLFVSGRKGEPGYKAITEVQEAVVTECESEVAS
eukprot:m.45560 g.45560  ORF g.45560 m.45560 type:complete len:464 (-) comp20000_c0_seq1:113-1504(-)